MNKEYDVAIIGGGPGGYVAAIKSSQLGLKTVLIENENLGGVCLNWGCIPTKALLRSSEVLSLIQHANDFGINVKDVSFDFKKIIQRSRDVSKKLSTGISFLMKKNKVDVVNGFGKILNKNYIEVSKDNKTQEIKAKNIIIATGARARQLENIEVNKTSVINYREALTLEKLPKDMLIVGSGAIGIEFANFYQTLGVKVTVVEAVDRILPHEDKEISEFAQKEFEKKGIKFLVNAKLKNLNGTSKKAKAIIEIAGKDIKEDYDVAIVAVGISANTEGLGLENLNIKLDRGHIVTDDFCKTGEDNIYAIGDVAGAPWLAHKASHEAIICLNKIANEKNIHKMDKNNIPACTYSSPQIASVGLTEEKAKDAGYDIRVGRFPFVGNGKAIALGEESGLVKVIFDNKTGELLGAHMVGAEVTEMIQGYVVGKVLEATELDFMNTIFPHPTLSEMMHEAVLDAYDKAIHV